MRQHESSSAAEHLRMMAKRNSALESKVTVVTIRINAQATRTRSTCFWFPPAGRCQRRTPGEVQGSSRSQQPCVRAGEQQRRAEGEKPADGAKTGHHAGKTSRAVAKIPLQPVERAHVSRCGVHVSLVGMVLMERDQTTAPGCELRGPVQVDAVVMETCSIWTVVKTKRVTVDCRHQYEGFRIFLYCCLISSFPLGLRMMTVHGSKVQIPSQGT